MNEPTLAPQSPTADDVRAIMRSQNVKVAVLAVVLILAVAIAGAVTSGYAAEGRDASENSRDAVLSQLAANERTACITDRRSEEQNAKREMIAALGRALNAGLLRGDTAEAERQAALFEKATERGDRAGRALEPDVLNQPKPVGCGPPIIADSDIAAEGAG